MSKVNTHSVLKILAAEYERSKEEQIQRFLKDQEELNQRFSEYAFGTEEEIVDNGNDDDSDTESIFTQRMSVYKSRPQTAMGWADLEAQVSDDSVGSANNNISDSEEEEWKSAIAASIGVTQAGAIGTGDDRKSKDETIRVSVKRKQGLESLQKNTVTKDRMNVRPDTRLLSRRTTRPRTATGIRTVKLDDSFNEAPQKERGFQGSMKEGGGTAARCRPLRSSAPASVSRVHKTTWEPDKTTNSLFPENVQSDGLMRNTGTPSYAGSGLKLQQYTQHQSTTPKSFSTPNANLPRPSNKNEKGFKSNNLMIISSMNPQMRSSKESLNSRDQDVPPQREYSRDYIRNRPRRDMSAEGVLPSLQLSDDTRNNKQLSVLKLPPLEGGNYSSSRPQSRTQGFNQNNQNRSNSRQQEFLAG